jgi:hypothetical protein
MMEQSARPLVSIVSRRTKLSTPFGRDVGERWQSWPMRGGSGRRLPQGGLCTIFHEVEAGSTAEGERIAVQGELLAQPSGREMRKAITDYLRLSCRGGIPGP